MMKFNYKKKYKVGDIITPFDNGTDRWLEKSIWSVVESVNKKGNWKLLKHWESDETAMLYSEILKIKGNKNE